MSFDMDHETDNVPDEPAWRVGRHQPRTIYYKGRFVAVAVGDEESAAKTANMIISMMNYGEATWPTGDP